MAKRKPRKNVTVVRGRGEPGEETYYHLCGKSQRLIATLSAVEWKDLGLRPLRKGQEAVVDLQVSGLPKKKKVRK